MACNIAIVIVCRISNFEFDSIQTFKLDFLSNVMVVSSEAN